MKNKIKNRTKSDKGTFVDSRPILVVTALTLLILISSFIENPIIRIIIFSLSGFLFILIILDMITTWFDDSSIFTFIEDYFSDLGKKERKTNKEVKKIIKILNKEEILNDIIQFNKENPPECGYWPAPQHNKFKKQIQEKYKFNDEKIGYFAILEIYNKAEQKGEIK